VDAKKQGYRGRIGAWLIEHCGLEEQRVTQALSLQWNCPVFSGEPDEALLASSPIPRIFLDTFGFVPLRITGSGSLFVAFEDRVDHSLTLAMERVTGRRVEAGLLGSSEFRQAHQCMMTARFPRAKLIEGAGADVVAAALARLIEKEQPTDAWIVRVHQYLWLRLRCDRRKHGTVLGPSVDCQFQDVVCSIAQLE
jgi:hypothetical protein